MKPPFLIRSWPKAGFYSLISFAACFPAALAQNTPSQIDIVVMEGEGAVTNIRQRVAHDPAVKVEDEDHRPVSGAVVVFALPVSGTSGDFANGSKNLTVVTNQDGIATAHGIKVNDIPGKLQIYVTASYRGLRARGLIDQTVEAPPGAQVKIPKAPAPELVRSAGSGGKWKWVVLGLAAVGGAGAGVYFGTHTSAPSPVSISTGTVVFGSPK